MKYSPPSGGNQLYACENKFTHFAWEQVSLKKPNCSKPNSLQCTTDPSPGITGYPSGIAGQRTTERYLFHNSIGSIFNTTNRTPKNPSTILNQIDISTIKVKPHRSISINRTAPIAANITNDITQGIARTRPG